MSIKLNLSNILSDIDENGVSQLRSVFDDYYPQDIAEQYYDLNTEERRLLFDILSYKQGAEVFAELDQSEIRSLLEYFSDSKIVKFANEMDLDDAADIIALLEDARMSKVLEEIQRPSELKELLSYDSDTCGGNMSPHFLSLRADLRVDAALRYVRIKAKETQNQIVYIYVTTRYGKLVGVLSLRDLFLANDTDTVAEHMKEDVISIYGNDDQEEAAALISKYRFLAIPVVNQEYQLIGIITVDDVINIIEQEATEDIYKSSGISVEEESTSVTDVMLGEHLTAYRARAPWLIISLLGQCFAATLIGGFEDTISLLPIAIPFMPLLSGMSGNVANQSMTIIVRGLSTGEVDIADTWDIFIHEVFVSFNLALTCSLITGGIAYFLYHNILLALLIAIALIISMILAVGLATVIPMLCKRTNLDPAIASGPLITTLVDVLSFMVYFSLITHFIKLLT